MPKPQHENAFWYMVLPPARHSGGRPLRANVASGSFKGLGLGYIARGGIKLGRIKVTCFGEQINNVQVSCLKRNVCLLWGCFCSLKIFCEGGGMAKNL